MSSHVRFLAFGLARLLTVFVTITATTWGQTTVANPLPANSLATFYHLPEGGGVRPTAFYPRLEVIDATSG